jgi:ATP-dependent Clp protease ATP-binding subunit ClpC
MESLRFPVLMLKDRFGQSTAIAIGADEQSVAIADSDSKAFEQLSDFLQWQVKRDQLYGSPDLIQPTLSTFRVPIRPEYRTHKQIYPCSEPFPLVVHCVHGKQERGIYYAELPLLRASFYYYEEKSLPELVARYAQEQLKGLTPRDVAAFLPPQQVDLRTLVVRIPIKRRAPEFEFQTRQLALVADALGDRQLRQQFRQAWERDEEQLELMKMLQSRRQNILLVGEPGVGKTALLATAIRQLSRHPAKPKLDSEQEETEQKTPVEKRYWLTSGSRMIAGMKYLGQWEQRCEQIVTELADLGGVLCIENLLDLVKAGGGEPNSSVASFLLPYLQRGELLLVAECSPAELDACRRLLPSLLEVFRIVNVSPFDRRRSLAVLNRHLGQLQQQFRLQPERELAEQTERLFRRFLPYQTFPGSTLSFLTDLFTAKARALGKGGVVHSPAAPDSDAVPNVATSDLLKQFVSRTGLPEMLLRDEMPLEYADVLKQFQERVIGQPDACAVAADLVTTYKSGLNDPARPVGTLLFCGPTGIGKTEMAKSIADAFFGHGEQRDRLVRLDMSEYSGYDAAYRLLTQPNGEPSRLIETLRRQPLSVVLFDEIEKASPDVFDVLLGLLDEGRLTDRFGRVTTFRCAIVIMTSNIGSDRQHSIGFDARHEASYEREVRDFFRPEFFNRLSGVVTFHPLDTETAHRIAARELGQLNVREGLVRRRLRIEWTDLVVRQVASRGFDARYGARPLQRTVERLIAGPLAHWLVTQSPADGTVIHVDWQSDAAVFRGRVQG